ncbi:MAG: sulfur carrier protein ThiS [Desulfuromonadaceae bacterium]|nr:sulfur carrier protein ThiS [Desulfuromonadaceae bacterium]
MKITLNGKEILVSNPLSIVDLLAEHTLDSTRVAVELNREVICANAFATTLLGDGDSLEIIHFVGGG